MSLAKTDASRKRASAKQRAEDKQSLDEANALRKQEGRKPLAKKSRRPPARGK